MGTEYREIGVGAIKYAKELTDGMSRTEIESGIEDLLQGVLNDPSDKRVKRCDYCGYWWRDNSLRNTKRTCCEDCKRSIKTLQRRKQRTDKVLLNPKLQTPKKHMLRDDYLWWLEYPCWANEYSMLKYGWKFERPMTIAKMDYVTSNHEMYGEGNRRKPRRTSDYHGDDGDKL